MADVPIFQDAWVTVSKSDVRCGQAVYRVAAINGVRISSVRHQPLVQVLGLFGLLWGG